MIHAPLEPHQVEEATQEALRREAYDSGMTDKYAAQLRTKEENLQYSILGAAAEKAVAYHLDKMWTGKGGGPRDGDVEDLEVRWSARPRLLMHPRDLINDRRFVAVTGDLPNLQILGYFHPSEITEDFWDDTLPVPAYNIPADALHPAEDLLP